MKLLNTNSNIYEMGIIAHVILDKLCAHCSVSQCTKSFFLSLQ